MSQKTIKLLLATHNQGKIKRFKQNLSEVEKLSGLKIECFTVADFGLENLEIEENGQNEQENAYIKAKTFWELLPLDKKMPCIALDTGCYFENVEPEDQPGKFVRRIAGKGEKITDLELARFYQKLCQKYGGEIKGYYFDANCIYVGQADRLKKDSLSESYYKFDLAYPLASKDDFTEVVLENTNQRNIIMTDQIVGEIPLGLPMMGMYRGGITGKYHNEMTESDYLLEISPLTQAWSELILSLPEENTLILGKYEKNMPVRRRSLAVLRLPDKKYLGFIKKPAKDDLDRPKVGESVIGAAGSSLNTITWPGGGVDLGESPSEAVLREIVEELGYTDLRLGKMIGGKIIHYFVGKKYRVASVTYGFEVDILDLDKRQKAEIDDGIYATKVVTKDEFLELCHIEIAREYMTRQEV